MKKLAAALLTVTAAAIAPIAWRRSRRPTYARARTDATVGVGGCTNVVGDVATGRGHRALR